MPRARGITPAEVFVLLVIGAVLVCLAVVGIQQARVRSRRALCTARLEQLAQGMALYRQAHGDVFPFGTLVNDDLPPPQRLSWYVGAWPFVGEWGSALPVDPDGSWADQPAGEPDFGPQPRVLCPTLDRRATPEGFGIASYVGIAGIGRQAAELPAGDPRAGVWGYDRQTPVQAITDGLRTTLLLAETARNPGPWIAGGPPTVRGVELKSAPMVGSGGQFGGLHPDGANVLKANGTATFLNARIDPNVLAAMATIAGAPADQPDP